MLERTVQAGVVYQDNHLAYDSAGRLRDVADTERSALARMQACLALPGVTRDWPAAPPGAISPGDSVTLL